MSRSSDRSLKRALAAQNGDEETLALLDAEDKADAAKEKKFKKLEPGEKTIVRKIMESDLYEWNPLAVLLLTQIAVLAMDEDSDYPEDAPESCKADKVGWCWMSQFKLALRCRCHEGSVGRWIKKFRKDGVIEYRMWKDDNGTPHAEYKIIESVFDAHQRPTFRRDAERTSRYSEPRKPNKGSFTTINQPGRSAQLRGIMEPGR